MIINQNASEAPKLKQKAKQ